jgi:hypothetical protein
VDSIIVTCFECPTSEGAELSQRLEQLFQSWTADGRRLIVQVIRRGTAAQVLAATVGDDVVILDASLDRGEEVCSHYDSFNAQLLSTDHVIVVSRTMLPLNFFGLRKGGAPAGGGKFTNEQIVDWLIKQLRAMLPELPRPERLRLRLDPDRIGRHHVDILNVMLGIMDDSFERNGKRLRAEGAVFLSYLSKYSKSHFSPAKWDGCSIEDLVGSKPAAGRNLFYIPPGLLSSEFMTESRRWQIFSTIDWRIRDSSEFWVFDTRDYRASWWTLAELTSLAFMRIGDPYPLKQLTLRRARPVDGGWTIEPLPEHYLPALNEDQATDFRQFLSHTDPLTCGPESIKAMQAFRQLPRLVQRALFEASKLGGKFMFRGVGGPFGQIDTPYPFARFEKMLSSRLYEESFWSDHILTCKECTVEAAVADDHGRWDIDALLSSRLAGMHRVSTGEMQRILDAGYWICPTPRCGVRYNILSGDTHFIWWPIRVGKITGPEGRSTSPSRHSTSKTRRQPAVIQPLR